MNEILVRSVLALCRFVGYRRVARALGPKVLEFSVKKATGSEIPANIVKVCLNTAPYIPAIALFSTTGIPGVITTASYVFLTQVSDQLFLFVIYEAVLGGFRAIKYAFWPARSSYAIKPIKRSADHSTKKEGKQSEQSEIESDWILVDETGDDEEVVKVDDLLEITEKDFPGGIDKKVLKETIQIMNELAEKMDPEKEGWGVNAKDVTLDEEFEFELIPK